MAVIIKKIVLADSTGREEVRALFDSRATYSCIQPELAERLDITVPLPEVMDFRTADKEPTLQATQAVRLNFYLKGFRFPDEFMVIPDLTEPVSLEHLLSRSGG